MADPVELYPVGQVDGRRAAPGERKTYVAKNLWQRHHEILNLHVLGAKGTEIARRLNITPQSVSNVINSPLAQQKIAAMRAVRDTEVLDVRKEVQDLLPAAMDTYREVLMKKDSDPKLKVQVANTIVMDLAGHAAPKKVAGVVAHVMTTPEIEELKKRGLEAGKALGCIVDGEVVEDENSGVGEAGGDGAGDFGGVED